MNKEIIVVGILALFVGGLCGYVFANRVTFNDFGGNHNTKKTDNNEEHRVHDGTTMSDRTGMEHMGAMTVSSEREFIEGMIPHHQEAVDTAKEVIERGGTTPEIKRLVEGIVTAQEAEISDMKRWYLDWYGTPYAHTGAYTPMMRDLERLSGSEIDRAFLSDMIMHHMGAIMMAHSVQPYITHDEVTKLTQVIVSTQSAEIAEMRRMLQGL